MAQQQVDTNEGAGENDELMDFLSKNRLLKAKQQFIDYEVTMDDLKAVDVKHELSDFIQNDLKLGGIIATRARKAIIALQSESGILSEETRTIILSNEEGVAIKEIENKCN
eukprot:358410_1